MRKWCEQMSPRGWCWRIQYACPIQSAPPGALRSLLEQLRAVADVLSPVRPESDIWTQLRQSERHLDADGWHFTYSVPSRGILRVTGAQQVAESGRSDLARVRPAVAEPAIAFSYSASSR